MEEEGRCVGRAVLQLAALLCRAHSGLFWVLRWEFAVE